MRQSYLPLLFLTLAFSLSTAAHADGFGVSGSGGGFSGSGVLTATDQGGGTYLITAMSGGGSPMLFAPGGFQGNDNLLFPTAAQYVDGFGFSFTISSGEDTDSVDISSVASGYQAYIVDEGGNQETVPVTFNLMPEGASPALQSLFAPSVKSSMFAFTVGTPAPVAAAPEPSSLALLGTGLTALVAMARRRARS